MTTLERRLEELNRQLRRGCAGPRKFARRVIRERMEERDTIRAKIEDLKAQD